MADEEPEDHSDEDTSVDPVVESAYTVEKPPTDFVPLPVLKSDGLHSYLDALAIIKNARVSDRQIIFQPPCRPLASGQVYVYALQDGQSPYDWRFDGFQWANLRANSFPKKNTTNHVITRHEFRLLDKGNKVDFFRHEYHEFGPKLKGLINLSDWKYPFLVIHYFGTYPINEAQAAPHGNRKLNGVGVGSRRKIELSTSNTSGKRTRKGETKAVVDCSDEIATAVEGIIGGNDSDGDGTDGTEGDEPQVVYEANDDEDETNDDQEPPPSPKEKKARIIKREITESHLDSATRNLSGVLQGNIGPNYKRRSALISSPKRVKTKDAYTHVPALSKDDLYGCYVFQESVGQDRVIRTLDFTNGVAKIIIAEDNFLKHINLVLGSGITKSAVKFNYAPTAKLYRFCLSTLFIRHPIFENEPNIPVAFYLHRVHSKETHTKFFKVMKRLIPALNSASVELTLNTENGVFPSAKEQLPENEKIKSFDASASPRTSNFTSPKLDFVLTAVAKHQNFDHVKTVHLVYFMQCFFLNEISRSLLGNCAGDLLIQSRYDTITSDIPSLAQRVLPDGLIENEDALGPTELISLLTRNPPVVLGSGSDYESCSRNELALFEGLAHFFLAKDRLSWYKDRRLFSVRGLAGVEYFVNLSGRTCSCTRGKACEHVLAVLIGTGILARQG